MMTMRNTALTLSMGSILALAVLSPAVAQTSKEAAAKTEATAVKTLDTAKDHLALADEYRKKAAADRAEAATHRQMLATYKKQVAIPSDGKAALENPWIKKMRLHCEEYIRDADKLAASADQFAEFHSMRAAELQGK